MRCSFGSRLPLATATLAGALAAVACSGTNSSGGTLFSDGGSSSNKDGSTGVTITDGGRIITGGGSGDGSSSSGDGGPCQGLQCQVHSCANDAGTTITGKIMDPAGANPLYNVLAFVPLYEPTSSQSTITAITGGVNFPSGVSCDSCSYLYTGNPIAVGLSGTDGTFTIPNAPDGTNIPVVIQVGKWRTHTTVANVTACTSNSAGNISLPSKGDSSDPVVSIPEIAISMGGSDTLECLPYRMGMDPSEFVTGPGGTGHIHLYEGGQGLGGFGFDAGGFFPGGGGGTYPESDTNLWNTIDSLNAYDVTLFSCEGSDTYNANPQLLEQYVNNGGRAFMSHFHMAWLAGDQDGQQAYTAPADWGTNLATWNDSVVSDDNITGDIVTTLNSAGGGTFQKGVDLQQWLGNVGALTGGALPIVDPAYTADVTATNSKVQPWITDVASDTNGFPTAYFSFDTPIGATELPDGGPPPYCGRVVFADLHVGSAAQDSSGGDPTQKNGEPDMSSNCSPGPGKLSPQEKALEFMLFDLSSCVTPDQAPPTPPIQLPSGPQ